MFRPLLCLSSGRCHTKEILQKLQEPMQKCKVLSFKSYCLKWGHAAGGAVVWGTALQAGRSRIGFPMVSLEFFIDINLPVALWSWI